MANMVAIGLVVAQFDKTGEIIPAMESAGKDAAADAGAEIRTIHRVPGSYDTPLAADRLARRDDIDAVAAIGAIITGETDHDRVIANAAANGLTTVSLERDTPVTLGIIGPGMTAGQARDRVHYGGVAVNSAIELAKEFEG